MNEIIQLFSRYEGKITEKADEITISAFNIITDFNGEPHRVECEVGIDWDKTCNYPYGISAAEKTYRLLGGMGSPCDDLAEALREAEKQLERYNFKHRKEEQLKLL